MWSIERTFNKACAKWTKWRVYEALTTVRIGVAPTRIWYQRLRYHYSRLHEVLNNKTIISISNWLNKILFALVVN